MASVTCPQCGLCDFYNVIFAFEMDGIIHQLFFCCSQRIRNIFNTLVRVNPSPGGLNNESLALWKIIYNLSKLETGDLPNFEIGDEKVNQLIRLRLLLRTHDDIIKFFVENPFCLQIDFRPYLDITELPFWPFMVLQKVRDSWAFSIPGVPDVQPSLASLEEEVFRRVPLALRESLRTSDEKLSTPDIDKLGLIPLRTGFSCF